MNLVKSKLKYEEKERQERKRKQGGRMYSSRYSITTKEKENKEESEDEEEEEDKELKNEFDNIKKLWNDLGVTKDFQKVYKQLAKNLTKKLKKEYYDYELGQLKKFRDYLIKLSKNITNREKTIYLLKELDINYFQEISKEKPNANTLDKLTGDITQAIKHLRIHSVNAVNHMVKIRDLCSYNIICGKYDFEQINKGYFFDKNYLIKMKFDLDFLKDTHLAEIYEFSEESDPFLLSLSPENEEDNKEKKEEEKKDKEEEKKRTIPMTQELYDACKQCQFIIMQDLMFFQIQNEKAEKEAQNQKQKKIKLGQSFKGNLSKSINKNKKNKEYEKLFYQSQMYKTEADRSKKDEIQPMTSEELLEKLDEYERKKKEEEKRLEEERERQKENEDKKELESLKPEEEEEKKESNEENKNDNKENEEIKQTEEEKKENEDNNKKEEEEPVEYVEGEKLQSLEQKLVFDKDADKEHEIFDKQIQYEEQTMKNFETYYAKPEEEKKDDKEEEIKEIQRAETTQKKHIKDEEIIQEEEIKEEKSKEEEKPKEEEHKDDPKEEIKEENIEEEPEKDEQIESIPKNNFTNMKPEDYKVSFFTKSFKDFEQDYSNYFPNIPDKQKTTFNISSSTSSFIEGINPKILYCYSNTNSSTLIGLCGVSFLHPTNNTTKLNITHISATTDDWPSIFKAFITFIQSNFKYNEINLLFYYKIDDNNSYEINKEIMSLFKDEFKFKWSKIENHSDEIRRQEMILLSEKNSTSFQANEIGTMNLKLNSMITLAEGETQSEQFDFDYQYMNLFLAEFAVNSLKQKDYELSTPKEENNKLINWDTDGIKVYLTCEEFTNDTTNDFNKAKSQITEDDIDKPTKENSIFSYIKMTLIPKLYSNITCTHNGYSYNRIEVEKYGTLKDTQTGSTIYVIPTADQSTSILLCEISPELQKNLFDNYTQNIYEKFYSYVESLSNEEQSSEKKFIWVPSFDIKTHLSCGSVNYLSDVHIKKESQELSLQNYDEFINANFKGDNSKENSFSVEPTDKDIIIGNSFLLGVSNIGIAKNLKIPVIALLNITKENWITA